jgi:hypothetical protein
MSRAVPSLFLAALALTHSAPARGADTRAASEPTPTSSRVTAVVIHRQHALVTREAEVVLADAAKANVTLLYRIRAPIGMLPVEP